MTHSIRRRISGWRKYLPKTLRDPLPRLADAGRLILCVILWPRRNPVIAAAVSLFAVALITVPTLTTPLHWLPVPGNGGAFLGSLLAAQATIAAFTFAVTLFVMQEISVRSDADERIHREYVRKSWIRNTLWVGLLSVAVTGAILAGDHYVSKIDIVANQAPGLRNLSLVASSGFLINLLLAGALFERAIHLSRPGQRWNIRRDVNQRDVEKGVQAFVARYRRTVASQMGNETDFTILFPDLGEGTANEAIRLLLEDARRAMYERRHVEFSRSLNSIRELIKYAMNQIGKTEFQWGTPGAQPEWPPLRELSRNLLSFRKDVIREADQDYIFELLRFDNWLASEGIRERCGELFTIGLNGYRENYLISHQFGGESSELIRERFAQSADVFILGVEPIEAIPYAKEMVKQQERLLYAAILVGQLHECTQLHKGFQAILRKIRFQWSAEDSFVSGASELLRELEQEYRIALMGLGGRAILLAQLGRIRDVNPYMEVGRGVYGQLGLMADDLAAALVDDDHSRLTLWEEWEFEDAGPDQVFNMSTERYPLTFFALRLLELSACKMPTLDFRGRAQQVLDWFDGNWESVGAYVPDEPDLTLDQRREFAIEALRAAVHRDEVAEDYDIIGRELSAGRVSAFKSDVYSAAISGNSVEQWFKRTGAFLHLSGDAADAPNEQQVDPQLMHKGFLTDTPETAHVGYAPLNGERWGTALSDLVQRRFYEALEGTPEMLALLDTPQALLQAIDRAVEDLHGPEHVIVLLAGNWFDLIVGLGIQKLEGYEESWRLPESDQLGEIGRYRGHPILRAYGHKGQCVYVVEPAGWGKFIRARAEDDQDLRVEISPVSIERARELLAANPGHFASEPDEESKLRKLQTQVEIVVGARTGFRVRDPSRALRVTPIRQPDVRGEEILS